MEAENRLLSLLDFEKNNIGTFTLTITNGSSFWNKSENLKRLNGILVILYNKIAEKIPTLAVLRAIVVTSDVLSEYDRLLEGTTRRSRVNAPREGILAGKVLTWGKRETDENYYAAIVLDEKICIAAFEDDNEGKAMIVHELAHVAEGFITRNIRGSKSEDIYNHEWEKIKYSKATTVYSEFFAQIMAYSYYPNKEVLQDHIDHAITFLRSVTDFLSSEIAKYRWHADMNRFWPLTVSELSRVFDQIGRSIGLLVCIDDENNEAAWKSFIDQIEAINSSWVPVMEEFKYALLTINNFEGNSFDPLCDAIDHGFNATGLIPQILEDGTFYIHVPGE